MPRQPIRDPRKDPDALLGKALRRLRQAAGFGTQAALAARLEGYGEDSVQKGESGGQIPTDDLFDAWLTACEATALDRAILTDLLDHARTADPVIPKFAEPWLRVERTADYLRLWSFVSVPGLLQTYEYAHAMYRIGGLNEDRAAAKATARVDRQSVISDPDGTRVTAVIHESVLRCLVGTPEIMVQQLTRLVQISHQPNMIIQIVRDTGYFVGLDGVFYLASGRTIPDTLTMVTIEDQTTTDPSLVDTAIALFERIRGNALPIEESRILIQEALDQWNSQQ